MEIHVESTPFFYPDYVNMYFKMLGRISCFKTMAILSDQGMKSSIVDRGTMAEEIRPEMLGLAQLSYTPHCSILNYGVQFHLPV